MSDPAAVLQDTIVLQVARHIGHGTGVATVVDRLEHAFKDSGIHVERLTAGDLGLDFTSSCSGRFRRTAHLFEVVAFSIVSPVVVRRRRLRHADRLIVISHNDCILGDIYVNHGLHKALMRERGPRGVLRNPLHPFLLVREELRHRLKKYRVVVCLSVSEKHRLMQNYRVARNDIEVIPNGVDLDQFSASRRAVATSSSKRLLFVGHEFHRKRLSDALDGLALLEDDVVLDVVGGPPDEIEHWTSIARNKGLGNRVVFHGATAAMAEVYRGGYCLIAPSSFESFLLVGLEAMAVGLPCVMSSKAAAGGYLRDGENGFLADSPEDIARCVRLLEQEDVYERMRANAIDTAHDYSWSVIGRRYQDVIMRLMRETV